MQRFTVALAGVAMILAGACSNKAMEAKKTETPPPASQSTVQQPDSTPAATPAPEVPATAALPGTTVGEDGATRITVDAASKMLKSGNAVLVDVRTDEQYKAQHAIGALHIPYTQLTQRLDELPPGKYIIAYCS